MQESEALIPGYLKIQNYVFDKIKSGEYPIGSKIPSEIELAELFGVSRVTANKAIKEMSVMGVLDRVRGRGTFVCADQIVPTESKAFGSAMKMNIGGSRKHQIVQFKIIKAYPELAEKAKVSTDELFYEIILVNKTKDRNDSLDYTYIPVKLVEDITKSLDYLSTHFVFDYLKTLHGVNPKYIKIFVNIPHFDFLKSASFALDSAEEMAVFSTDVYDANMRLLATTYTTYPTNSHDIPLMTFSI